MVRAMHLSNMPEEANRQSQPWSSPRRDGKNVDDHAAVTLYRHDDANDVVADDDDDDDDADDVTDTAVDAMYDYDDDGDVRCVLRAHMCHCIAGSHLSFSTGHAASASHLSLPLHRVVPIVHVRVPVAVCTSTHPMNKTLFPQTHPLPWPTLPNYSP